MFTGIVQTKGKIAAVTSDGSGIYIEVSMPRTWRIAKGASVAVDGICLTATKTKPGSFSAYLMPETLRKTTGSTWKKGKVVNLERALRQDDLLDGHLIQGHVDGRGTIASVTKEGHSKMIVLSLPRVLAKSIALHGSVAVNGVSLTVSRMRASTVTVSLIPYTLSHTNLDALEKGDEVNIEADFLGRHAKTRSARVRSNATRRTR